MPPAVTPGQIVGGKYRVDRLLGEGGMGYVVAAVHEELGQRVAIKFLLPEVAVDPSVVARFKREARAAARIENEHVVRVLDVADLPDGTPIMVMEFLDGEDLAAVLEKRGRVPFGEAVDHVLEACVALAEAHEAGIVHRDLKPANLFLARRKSGPPLVKLLDFGISKQKAEAGGALTSTQAVMGTPFYMSPEQIRSTRDVDGRSDIWALGVILFETMAGRLPFEGETAAGIIAAIVSETPPDLAGLVPDFPPGLGAVVTRCLEKSRDKRHASVAELAEALGPYASARGQHALARIRAVSGLEPPRTPQASGADFYASAPMPTAAAGSVGELTGAAERTGAKGGTAVLARASDASGAAVGAATRSSWAGSAPEGQAPRRSVLPWVAVGALALGGVGAALAFGARGGDAARPEPSAGLVSGAGAPTSGASGLASAAVPAEAPSGPSGGSVAPAADAGALEPVVAAEAGAPPPKDPHGRTHGHGTRPASPSGSASAAAPAPSAAPPPSAAPTPPPAASSTDPSLKMRLK